MKARPLGQNNYMFFIVHYFETIIQYGFGAILRVRITPNIVFLFRAPLCENSPLKAELVPKVQDKTTNQNNKSKWLPFW